MRPRAAVAGTHSNGTAAGVCEKVAARVQGRRWAGNCALEVAVGRRGAAKGGNHTAAWAESVAGPRSRGGLQRGKNDAGWKEDGSAVVAKTGDETRLARDDATVRWCARGGRCSGEGSRGQDGSCRRAMADETRWCAEVVVCLGGSDFLAMGKNQ